MTCAYCLAPLQNPDTTSFKPGPICGTHSHSNPPRTEACIYIERLRRIAESLDTAVMGLVGGAYLGGSHMNAPLAFAGQPRADYAELGEFTLPEEV